MKTARTSGTSRRLPSVPQSRRCFPSTTTTGRPSPFCVSVSPTPMHAASCAGSRSSTRTSSPPIARAASRTASPARCSGGRPMRRLRRPTSGLWSHPDFLKLWTGQSISEFGSQISQLAIPWLAAVGLHATPLEFSILNVLGFLPFILFALPAGVWVDRLRRKPILIIGDGARAVLLAYIPLAWALGILDIWQLMALQFVIGIFTVFFDVAYQSYLPYLVERDQLVEGNSKLQITVSAAQGAGPAIGGGLIQAITAPYAVFVDAFSFVASGAFSGAIKKREQVAARVEGARQSMWAELREGLSYVLRHPYLRPQAMCTSTSNFFGSMSFAILLVFAARDWHMSAGIVGIGLGLGSLGWLLGAVFVGRLQAWL